MCNIISSLPEKAIVVELGTSYGLTAAMFMLTGEKKHIDYWGIDNFSLESKYDKVNEDLTKLNLPYHLISSRTQDYPWNTPIDFLFVDAGHDEANVKPDCEKWIPFVKAGGYVSFHDWLGCKDPSLNPHWAVDYYGDLATPGWEVITHIGNQMLIKRKPS